MQQNIRWIIIDGDDTLWYTTYLYKEAREQVGNMLERYGVDPLVFDKWAREHDVEQAKTKGYAMHRYPLSLKNAVEHFMGGECEQSWAAMGIGYSVYTRKSNLKEYAQEFLLDLKNNGWKTILLTAGEVTVQQKRVKDFPWSDLLDIIRIVPKKDIPTLEALVQEFSIDSNLAVAIGDSLRSDIIPAHHLGIKGILLDANNWKDWEINGHDYPNGINHARDLKEAQTIINTFYSLDLKP